VSLRLPIPIPPLFLATITKSKKVEIKSLQHVHVDRTKLNSNINEILYASYRMRKWGRGPDTSKVGSMWRKHLEGGRRLAFAWYSIHSRQYSPSTKMVLKNGFGIAEDDLCNMTELVAKLLRKVKGFLLSVGVYCLVSFEIAASVCNLSKIIIHTRTTNVVSTVSMCTSTS
jgi:hypothetical protein